MRFPCLLISLCHVGMCVRKGFGAESTPVTATHVVDKITSLVQTHLAESSASRSKVQRAIHAVRLSTQRASEQITPGMRPALNEALTKVVTEIERIVDKKIKEDHQNTQTAIDGKVQNIRAHTQEAKARHEDAVNLDKTWFECVAEEKAKLELVEQAERSVADSRAALDEPCQRKEDTSDYSVDLAVDKFVFQCDKSQDSNCSTAFGTFDQNVETLLSDLKSKKTAASNAYQQATDDCQKANDDLNSKKADLGDKRNAWLSQRVDCDDAKDRRDAAMCHFGLKLKTKCVSVSEYHSLIVDVEKSSGGVYSHPDRVQQWRASHVTKCMLGKVVSDFEINIDTMNACAATVDFEAQVGKLDKKTIEVADLTSDANFTCKEETIKFFGQIWARPEDEDNAKSEDYIRSSWQPEINFGEDSAPFAFCETDVERGICADHRCMRGKIDRGLMDHVCQAASCTDDECGCGRR